jgi:microsomal dipeptidase-like Zn-dependent dipeptidase
MNELRIIPDLAHASVQTANEVLDLYHGPVIVSHTGLKGVVNNNRNISDALAKRVAKSGGVIGIGFWDEATGGKDVKAIVRSIKYGRDLVGADHIGLGSDFDGTVTTPFDASGMALVTQELLKEGFTPGDIAKIMGGNVLRVLKAGLPK